VLHPYPESVADTVAVAVVSCVEEVQMVQDSPAHHLLEMDIHWIETDVATRKDVEDFQKQLVASLSLSHPGHIASHNILVVLVASAQAAETAVVLRFPRYSL
jgi:hypothetical protein